MIEKMNPGMADESAETPDQEQAETAEIPMSIVGNAEVNPGDVIRLKVVSANPEGGSITVTYDHGDEEAGGSDKMAADFDNQAIPTTG